MAEITLGESSLFNQTSVIGVLDFMLFSKQITNRSRKQCISVYKTHHALHRVAM